jgi:signal transduction histidine kinase
MDSLTRVCVATAVLIAVLATNAAAEPRRVLLLSSFGPQFGPWNFYAARFREEIVKQSRDEIDLYEVALQSARFAETEDQEPIIQYLRSLFAGHKLDLIVSIGAPAAKFAQHFRPQFFPSIPLVMGAAERRAVEEAGLTANDVYIPTTLNFNGWIDNILRVLPDTKHIAWAVGASPLERYWNAYFRRASEPFSNRVTFEWFDALTFDQMLKRVAELPPDSAIFFVDLRVDAAGAPLDTTRALEGLHAAARSPIFSYVDGYFGHGIVGGPLRSAAETGQVMAAVAVRILSGESPGNIKPAPLAEGKPTYDWRELQRWSISESRLPAGSEIAFRPLSAWQQYRWQILAATCAFLIQACLIFWLTYEHRRRQRAEVQSRNSLAELAYMNRVASAGLLSASLAHEVNQPLTGIVLKAGAALRWMAAEAPDMRQIRLALTQIVEAGHRAGDVISNVKAMFSKSDSQAKQPVDINKLIRSVLGLVYIDLRKHDIQTQTVLADSIPLVAGNEVQLQQVILNLAMNAIEAMSSTEPRVLSIKSELNKDNDVYVSIGDTGNGIDPANMESIFKPLFTTKAHGIGMGLSICRSIIEAHEGRIWVSPGAEQGSVFQFVTP